MSHGRQSVGSAADFPRSGERGYGYFRRWFMLPL